MHHLIAFHRKRDHTGANKLHLNFVHGELILIGSNISFYACSQIALSFAISISIDTLPIVKLYWCYLQQIMGVLVCVYI